MIRTQIRKFTESRQVPRFARGIFLVGLGGLPAGLGLVGGVGGPVDDGGSAFAVVGDGGVF